MLLPPSQRQRRPLNNVFMNDREPLKSRAAVTEAEEETGHLDDAVIGRAFRGSAFALVALLLVGGATWWYLKRKPAPAAPKLTQLSSPVAPQRAMEQMP